MYGRMRLRFARKSDLEQEERETKELDEFEENAWLTELVNSSTVTTMSTAITIESNNSEPNARRMEWWFSQG